MKDIFLRYWFKCLSIVLIVPTIVIYGIGLILGGGKGPGIEFPISVLFIWLIFLALRKQTFLNGSEVFANPLKTILVLGSIGVIMTYIYFDGLILLAIILGATDATITSRELKILFFSEILSLFLLSISWRFFRKDGNRGLIIGSLIGSIISLLYTFSLFNREAWA